MPETSVRELIKSRQKEIMKSEDLLPGRAAEILAQLAALLGNCNDEIRKRDMEYNKILLLAYETEEKANKYYLKAREEEMNIGKYQ